MSAPQFNHPPQHYVRLAAATAWAAGVVVGKEALGHPLDDVDHEFVTATLGHELTVDELHAVIASLCAFIVQSATYETPAMLQAIIRSCADQEAA